MSEEQTQAPRIWVFGVVSADAELKRLESADDLPEVSLLEEGDLAAIIGDVPEDDPKGTRNQALAHARVLEAAVRDAPVIPMRFGTMCPDDDAVANGILKERHDELLELLDKFRDSVQLVLKVTYDEKTVLREMLDDNPEAAKLREAIGQGPEEATRDQRVRLGEFIANELEQRRQRDGAELNGQLDDLVQEARSEPPEKEWMVLNAPLLVERDRLDEVEQALEEIAEDRSDRMHFKLLGPMPVFHFLGDESEQPANA